MVGVVGPTSNAKQLGVLTPHTISTQAKKIALRALVVLGAALEEESIPHNRRYARHG